MTLDLRAAHRHATGNRAAIAASDVCGCFYCCHSYPAIKVTQFLATEHTALCPLCTIDSVIGDASGLPIVDRDFLVAMHEFWFGGIEIPELDLEDLEGLDPSPALSGRPSEGLLGRFASRFLSKKKTHA